MVRVELSVARKSTPTANHDYIWFQYETVKAHFHTDVDNMLAHVLDQTMKCETDSFKLRKAAVV